MSDLSVGDGGVDLPNQVDRAYLNKNNKKNVFNYDHPKQPMQRLFQEPGSDIQLTSA